MPQQKILLLCGCQVLRLHTLCSCPRHGGVLLASTFSFSPPLPPHPAQSSPAPASPGTGGSPARHVGKGRGGLRVQEGATVPEGGI